MIWLPTSSITYSMRFCLSESIEFCCRRKTAWYFEKNKIVFLINMRSRLNSSIHIEGTFFAYTELQHIKHLNKYTYIEPQMFFYSENTNIDIILLNIARYSADVFSYIFAIHKTLTLNL